MEALILQSTKHGLFTAPETIEEAEARLELLIEEVTSIELQLIDRPKDGPLPIDFKTREEFLGWRRKAVEAKLVKQSQRGFLERWLKRERRDAQSTSPVSESKAEKRQRLHYEREAIYTRLEGGIEDPDDPLELLAASFKVLCQLKRLSQVGELTDKELAVIRAIDAFLKKRVK